MMLVFVWRIVNDHYITDLMYDPQVTGEPLIRRSDDNAEALKKRLEAYHKQTRPLVDYYGLRGLHFKVDAAKKSSDVFSTIETIFQRKRPAQVQL